MPDKSKLKFAGPIKLVVIEGKDEYCRTVWCAAGIGLAHIFLGAANMAALIYSLKTLDIHATVCCFAYHFLSAEAILCLNYANGWSTPLRLRHRRIVHAFLQVCSLACLTVGTLMVTTYQGWYSSAHGLIGIISAILAGCSLFTGILAYVFIHYMKYPKVQIVHMTFGMLTFMMSSISLSVGLYTAEFKKWAVPPVEFVLLGFITYYSIFILSTVFIKCMIKL